MDNNKDKLWQNYWENGDDSSLNGLMNAYMPMIVSIAEDVISEHPDRAVIDNLYADGLFALKDCIMDYAKDSPTPFEDICRKKIKQAMVEEMDGWMDGWMAGLTSKA